MYSMKKQYISGHDVRRFFLISEYELRNFPKHAIQKNGSYYHLYEMDFMSHNYKKRGDVPEHLIISYPNISCILSWYSLNIASLSVSVSVYQMVSFTSIASENSLSNLSSNVLSFMVIDTLLLVLSTTRKSHQS